MVVFFLYIKDPFLGLLNVFCVINNATDSPLKTSYVNNWVNNVNLTGDKLEGKVASGLWHI